MKRIITLALLIISVAMLAGSSASAFDFADIQFWVGSGSNQAALVIDWNDGKDPVSLAWGYRWDGAAKGADMLTAIVHADSRLYAYTSSAGTYGSLGTALYGLGYDIDKDGFGTTPAVTFVNGIANGTYNDSRVAADSDDHYKEGWMSAGYWSYYLKSSSTASWGYSGVGMSSRTLSNGCWDGWSWAPGFSASTPSTPVAATAVPEPGSLIALLSGVIGMGGLVIRRRMN